MVRQLSGEAPSLPSQLDKAARIAGALYLLAILVGPFSLIYVPNTLLRSDDPLVTARDILAHEMLFRLAIVGDLLIGIIFLFVVLALYRLLKEVDQNLAVLMVILGGIMQTLIFVLNALNWVAALLLMRGAAFLAVFDTNQRYALAMLFIHLHAQGNVINEMFWGLWLFPFGVLVIKSRFLPSILGIWLIVECFAYVILSLTGLLRPQYYDTVFTFGQPAFFAEIAIALWLLIRGAKVKPISVPA